MTLGMRLRGIADTNHWELQEHSLGQDTNINKLLIIIIVLSPLLDCHLVCFVLFLLCVATHFSAKNMESHCMEFLIF